MNESTFRKSYYIKIHRSETKNLGIFNYEVELEGITVEITQELINWCSQTCQDNFIISEIKSRIVAGGTYDNYKSWCNGRFNASKKWHPADYYYTIFIRLMKNDYLSFMLRYSDEIT